jgi:hypothetical protein
VLGSRFLELDCEFDHSSPMTTGNPFCEEVKIDNSCHGLQSLKFKLWYIGRRYKLNEMHWLV